MGCGGAEAGDGGLVTTWLEWWDNESCPAFLCSRCYISLSMSIQSVYRRMPDYLAVPVALLPSAFMALTLAVLGAEPLDFLVGKLLHRPSDLGVALLVWFCAAPSIAVLGFVFCFSILINWHHAASWRAPTFAFALGSILLWLWAHDWIGSAWYIPGTIAWLISCWFLRRRSISHSKHVLEA
jgi:hypothetical protein